MHAPFTGAGFRRGMRVGLALSLPILIYGLAFGLVAAQVGMGWGWALGWSAGVFSGSAQLAVANLIQTGHVTLSSIALTVLIMNARYLLFGATIQPWLSQAGPARALPSLLLIGDANWIATMRAAEQGEEDRAYLIGTGFPLVLVWLAGTVAGAIFGQILPDPHALGADLMLPAFAAAMMAVMIRSRLALVPVAVGAASAIAVAHFAGAGWGIVAAGVCGAAFAALTVRTGGAR